MVTEEDFLFQVLCGTFVSEENNDDTLLFLVKYKYLSLVATQNKTGTLMCYVLKKFMLLIKTNKELHRYVLYFPCVSQRSFRCHNVVDFRKTLDIVCQTKID